MEEEEEKERRSDLFEGLNLLDQARFLFKLD